MLELISLNKLHYKCLQRTAESQGCGSVAIPGIQYTVYIVVVVGSEQIPSKKSNDQTGGVCSLFLLTVTCSDYRKYSKCNIRWTNIIYLFFTKRTHISYS